MRRILPLQNIIQDYTWGSTVHIARLMGKSVPSNAPQAEVWMGAHPKAPSRVGDKTLLEMIDADPQAMLGNATIERFGKHLPFLFKLLAAGQPLSIQAHPNLDQARKGFALENAAGIPLDAPNRNYKDDNHKPEILCAISEFWGLNGFRRIPKLIELLDEVGLPTLAAEVDALREQPSPEGLKMLFLSLLGIDNERKVKLLDDLLQVANARKGQRPEYDWALRISNLYPGDIGVMCVLLLNLVKLEPGEAMFCASGELHAYLDGFGVELMANSDNVLRGGLTAKHVDIPELKKTLTFMDRDAEILHPVDGKFNTPADEFELEIIEIDGEKTIESTQGMEILVNVRGNTEVICDDESVSLAQGASVAIPSEVKVYTVKGSATIYKGGVGNGFPGAKK